MKPTGIFFQWAQVTQGLRLPTGQAPRKDGAGGQAGLGSVAVLPTSISVKEEGRLHAYPGLSCEARHGKCYWGMAAILEMRKQNQGG